jgi:uncharacterized short protein YbdD (DUF466 family)
MPNPTLILFVLQDFVDYQLGYFKNLRQQNPNSKMPTREELVSQRKKVLYENTDNGRKVKKECRNPHVTTFGFAVNTLMLSLLCPFSIQPKKRKKDRTKANDDQTVRSLLIQT